MKNQKILILSGALLLATLVGCGPKTLKTEKAEEVISGFDTTLTGTVKATYHADYVLDVQSESASAKAFAEDVDKTVTIEADYTAGSLYLYAGYTVGEAKTEALVYNDSGKYYFLESTLGNPVELADEAAALAKMEELVVKVSKTKAGWVSGSTFLYTGSNAYEHKQFLLNSTNVPVEDMDDTRTFVENKETGGLDITSTMGYVGYTTDAGVSELSAQTEGKVGSNVTVKTDATGHVVYFNETYDEAKLEMPIMTPAPLLTLTGSHEFSAEYGAAIEKKTTIDHKATFGTVTFTQLDKDNKGYFEVFHCEPKQEALAKMEAVTATTQIPVGNWICIKVTPAEGNTVKAVTYGGSSETLIPPQFAGGYYCFVAKDGENAITVNYDGSAVLPTTATASVTTPEGITVTGPVGFTLAGQAPSAWDYVAADGFAFGGDKWIAIGLKGVPEGKEAVVMVEGKEAFFLSGYYCVNAKLPKDYKYTVTLKDAAPATATVTVTADANVKSYELGSMVPPNYSDISAVTTEVKVGTYLTVLVTCNEGYVVDTVTTKSGSDLAQYGSPHYCLNVKTADAIEVIITTKAA